MADETNYNGEFADDHEVEISGENYSKIADLEQENDRITQENKGFKQQIEELKDSVKLLNDKSGELKKRVDEADSENKTLGAVAARAAELEMEVSRLQHDLVSTTSDLEETTVELSDMKRDMIVIKEREKESDVKLDALEKERNLLVSKVQNLEDVLDGKEREIQVLKKNIQELEAMVGSSKTLEKLKNDLEKTVEKMKLEISVLEGSLDEKEKVILGLERRERAVDGVNGDMKKDIPVEVGKKGLIGNLNPRDWVVVAGSTFAAIAVVGVGCYIQHAARKH